MWAALESMVSIEQDEERLLVTMSNEINALIPEHFLLVLDDYHLISASPLAGHVISRLLQLTGENVHLVLASRNLPDLPDLPLLIARNLVGGMTFDELSFLSEEIQKLFQQNNGIALNRQDADELMRQTEGWIAAIHLSNGRPNLLPRMHPLESTRELFDFFSREVLIPQTEEMRQFLLMTSVFEAFDTDLCIKVLDPLMEGKRLDWASLFNAVHTNNIFSVPVDAEGRWMRYHHLFQHFLRSQLQFEQPVLAWHIQHQLASVYEEQQSWEEALQVYARLDDYDGQVQLLKHAGSNFISSGRILTLANWLEKLPNEILYSQPMLLSLLGVVHTSRGDNHRALELLNLAEFKLRGTEDEESWLTTLIRRAEVGRLSGQFEQALADVDEVLQRTGNSTLSVTRHNHAESQRIKGLALLGAGDTKSALPWLEEALHTCRELGFSKTIPILETELGVVHRRLGNPDLAARYYASALEAWKDAGNTSWKARLLNNLGLLYHKTGKLEEALSFLQESLNTAERSGYTSIQTNILISLGDLHTDLADQETAFDYYDQALTLATRLGNSSYIFYASLGQARLQRMGGESLLAIEELKQAEFSQVKMGTYEKGLLNLELGCCWLQANKLEPAIVVLRDAVELFEKGDNQMELAVARLWLATATSVQFPGPAVESFHAVLPPQREWQKPVPVVIHAGQASIWLKKRGSSQIFKDVVLCRFFELAEQVHQSLPELIKQATPVSIVSPPTLEILSFGEARVFRNKRLVSLSNWQTREARDLFFFLLQSPPMTKERIALEFWPDISQARLKMRFKINIYRIRQAMGQDVILYADDKYYFNRDIQYSWDREKLDDLLQTPKDVDPIERLKIVQQASEFCKSSYLADLDGEWTVHDRLRYQDIHQDLLVELAGLYLQVGDAGNCLEIAREVLRANPLLETAHRLAIQAHASLHDPAGMTLQFRKYQQVLMVELGLPPSLEMSKLYEKLLDAI